MATTNARLGRRMKRRGRETHPRQTICGLCRKPIPLGDAIVRDFGASGRVHKRPCRS